MHSPSSSPSPSQVEVIKQAIKQLMEEVDIREGSDRKSSSDGSFVAIDGDDDVEDDNHGRRRFLSKLMSQLETSKTEPDDKNDEDPTEAKSNTLRFEKEEEEEERILKEIKKVKRQNLITHCLLSVMIVVTIAWQISEVNVILKVKDRVNHPFRSLGGFFKGMLKAPKANGSEEESDSLNTSNLIKSTPLHDLKIPELPHVDLPKIDLGYEDED